MSRNGFTLLELIVALSLGGLALALTVGVFSATADGVRAVDRSAAEWDRDENARRFLSQVFASAEVGTSTDGGFQGEANETSFGTWLWVADGWTEPDRVTIRMEEDRLSGDTSSGSLTLLDSVAALDIDYLSQLGANSPWLSAWRSATSVPLAVRLRVTRINTAVDTMLFWIGPRG
jgi:prepilin-type N-terminal cleavage/methylation domain-containing protein